MMPSFNDYEDNGRTLMVKFTCQRCGKEHTGRLEDHDKDPESYGYLRSLKPPKGWIEIPYHTLLCPECSRAFVSFMRNEKEDDQ